MNLIHEFAQIGIDIRHRTQEVKDLIEAIYANAEAEVVTIASDGLDDIDEQKKEDES